MVASVSNPDDDRIAELLTELGVSKDFRLSASFVSEVLGLIADEPHTLDLKIAAAAVTEMRDAFSMFEPYKGVPTTRCTSRPGVSPTASPRPAGWS